MKIDPVDDVRRPKRLCCLILALSLMVGCAESQAVKNFICSPTPDQQADAAQILVALDSAQSVVAMFYPPAAIVKASSVLTVIQGGGCFLLDELAQIFAMLDKAQAAKMKAVGPVRFDTYPSLRRLLRE